MKEKKSTTWGSPSLLFVIYCECGYRLLIELTSQFHSVINCYGISVLITVTRTSSKCFPSHYPCLTSLTLYVSYRRFVSNRSIDCWTNGHIVLLLKLAERQLLILRRDTSGRVVGNGWVSGGTTGKVTSLSKYN